jgi:pimeloyl-ACP methyl ester carboxylesterase
MSIGHVSFLPSNKITANGMTFSVQTWGDPRATPMLALHGWLDNSASFEFIGPLLKDVYVIAVDMAGHGLSDHRPGMHNYHTLDDVNDVFAIADALQIDRFYLLGHSRGAIVASLSAATFPERIIGLVLIEGGVPEAADEDLAPNQVASAITSLRAATKKRASIYPSLKLAASIRAQSAFPVSISAAETLVARGMEPCKGGYQWRHDARLHANLMYKLTSRQIAAFMANITAPILLILGHDGFPRRYPDYEHRLATLGIKHVVLLEGNHHVHMHSPEDVAKIVNHFLSSGTDFPPNEIIR